MIFICAKRGRKPKYPESFGLLLREVRGDKLRYDIIRNLHDFSIWELNRMVEFLDENIREIGDEEERRKIRHCIKIIKKIKRRKGIDDLGVSEDYAEMGERKQRELEIFQQLGKIPHRLFCASSNSQIRSIEDERKWLINEHKKVAKSPIPSQFISDGVIANSEGQIQTVDFTEKDGIILRDREGVIQDEYGDSDFLDVSIEEFFATGGSEYNTRKESRGSKNGEEWYYNDISSQRDFSNR